MNLMKNLFFSALPIWFVYACQDETLATRISPSTNYISLDGEGGKVYVQTAASDWRIESILNQDGQTPIWGESYTIDGRHISQHKKLKLDSLGRVESKWSDKGLSVTRSAGQSLDIEVDENSTGKEFCFVIVLRSATDRQEIIVHQKTSQGYSFEKITYMLKDEDGDSLFVKRKQKVYTVDSGIGKPINVGLWPFYGVKSISYFESKVPDAFIWLQADSIEVPVPGGMVNVNPSSHYAQKQIYGIVAEKLTQWNDLQEDKTFPSGKTVCYTDLEWCQRRVTYQLHLVNNRTGVNKVIEGKWIEIAPTGNYEFEFEYTPLPN